MKVSSYTYTKTALRCISSLLLLSVFTGCEKELDFKYHDVPSPLVIEGTLTGEGTNVRLTYATPMDEAMDLTPVTDAEVLLTDITAGIERALPLKDDGSFGDVTPGVPGHEYRVDVKTSGKEFRSESAMKDKTEIVDMQFQWIKMPYDYVAVLRVTFKEIPDDADNCFWVRILRNGKPYKWSVIDRRIGNQGLISCVMMTSRKDLDEEDEADALREGDEVTALVIPIDRKMVDYLTALANDSNGPRMWHGDFCLGYFLAAPVATTTIIFHPDELTEYK
ncbi:MAG: hypothetical protein K2G67_02365 [Muribaculaceae bacterium]|nr:hypothetical protein [Muribaculaceae bacterium]